MRSPCDPPEFDEQDWSQFDFSRWHLDGIQLDSTSTAVADLAQRLFHSPQWQENFKTTLPQLQSQMLRAYQEDSKQLETEKAAVAQDFDQRVATTQERSANLSKAMEAAGAPLVLQPSPGTYQVAAKVTDADGHLGLAGITVQLMDPRNPKTPLLLEVTDSAGNAVLSLPEEIAKALDAQHTAFQVVNSAGKVVQEIADAVCIRLNQTETRVIPLADSAGIKDNKAAALQIRSRRELEARSVAAKIDLLNQERESRLRALDCRLEQNQAIIDSLQSPATPSAKAETSSSPQSGSRPSSPAPKAKSNKKDSSPSRGKGRKK